MSNIEKKHNKPSIEEELRDLEHTLKYIYINYHGYVPSTLISNVEFDTFNLNINSYIQFSLPLNGINTLEDLLTNYSKMNKKYIGEEAQRCIDRFIRTYYPFSLKDKDFLGKALEEYKMQIETDLKTMDSSIQRLRSLLDELELDIPGSSSNSTNFINMLDDKTGERNQHFLNKTREIRDLMGRINALIPAYDGLRYILNDNLEFSIKYYETYLKETYPDFGEV